tara:strand:+ start:153 stop:449 length:297 start_codon:yes stop_codon:yes gene_type:complete
MGKAGEPPDLSPDRRCVAVLVTATPWLLLVVGTVLLFLGIYYREFTNADTPNGALIAVGCAMILLAFSLSCVTHMPKKAKPPPKSRETQLLPNVPVTL